jgi:Tfp pilus assembly PilM family ATPase
MFLDIWKQYMPRSSVKRCIGIDLGPDHMRAVQLSESSGQFLIEKTYSTQTRRYTDRLPSILRSLVVTHGFARSSAVACSMPDNAVFFRDIETDSDNIEQYHQSFSEEHNFPIQAGEMVWQVYSNRPLSENRFSTVIVAANRQSLSKRIGMFTEANLHLKMIDAVISAIHATAVINHPEIRTGSAVIAYISDSHLALAITKDGDMLIVRNVPVFTPASNNTIPAEEQLAEMLAREAQLTWRKVFATEIDPDSSFFLASDSAKSKVIEGLIQEKLSCRFIVIDPYARIKTTSEQKPDFPIALAEGLALRFLIPDLTNGVNFLKADIKKSERVFNIKKEILTCTVLIAAIVILLLVGLFLRLSRLEAAYASTKSEINEIFKATLPDEYNIVNPVAQLEQKLQSFRNDYRLFTSFGPDTMGPLHILGTISANTPMAIGIKIEDMLITESTARLVGTCGSFESLYQWQKILQKTPAFRLVDVEDAHKQPGTDLVSFTMLISLKGYE